jgi:hypothetical protein
MEHRGDQLPPEISPAAQNVERAHQLIESFTWADTAEGHGYWEEHFWALLGVSTKPGLDNSTTREPLNYGRC